MFLFYRHPLGNYLYYYFENYEQGCQNCISKIYRVILIYYRGFRGLIFETGNKIKLPTEYESVTQKKFYERGLVNLWLCKENIKLRD
jgi:hypothetical protein